MKKTLFSLFATVVSLTYSGAQNVDWILGDNGQTNPPGKNIGAICHDSAGRIIIAGVFSNFLSMSNSTPLTTRGLNDVFLVSMNPDSTVNWTKQIGGLGSENFNGALSVDHLGNIYLAGSFGDSMWIDTKHLLHTGPSAPGFRSDIFMSKFDPAGNLLWLKQTKGFDIEYATDIAADSSGNVFVSGQFDHDTDFGDSIMVDNTGESDAFVCKYDKNGTLVWKKILQSTDWSHEDITSIEASPDGYVYVGGFYYDTTTTFDNQLLPHPYNGGQCFVAAIAPSGTVSWIRYFESPNGGSFIEGMKLRGDKLYVAGNFVGYLTINPTVIIASGGMDIFLTSMSSMDGSVYWSRKYGHTGAQKMIRHGFQASSNGNFYFTGDLRDSTRFDTLLVTSAAYQDIFVAVCDSNGAPMYLNKATGTGDQIADAIDVDTSGKVYMSGTSLSGNISLGNKSVPAPTAGIFLAKFMPATVIPVLSIQEFRDKRVIFYPNPVQDLLYWSVADDVKALSITVYNITGAILYSATSLSSNAIDLSGLSSGTYIVTLQTDDCTVKSLVLKN
jgi:hypothetical protein